MSSVIVKQVCESLDSLVLVKEGATETQTKRTLLVVATKKKYETISLEKLPGVDVPLVEAVRAGYTELATAHSANGVAVSLAVLPTKASRTFGPIRSDLLHSIVSANLVAANKDSDADIVVLLDSPEQIIAATLAVARAFPLYYNKLKPQRARSIFFHVISSPNSDGSNVANTATLQILVDSCRAAARLVDTPPNELNPTTYVQTVRDIHSSLLRPANVVLDIIQGTELRDREYGGIWNVGKASQNLPALVVLSYSPPFPTKSEKSVAWVGKGITYDTGGLSIKSKEGMPTMKVDMGGSAGVLHAFIATILTNPPKTFSLHAILCIAENSVDSTSMRPDDIIIAHSGKTIEVNNTDAEGRLVLCDGAAHACKALSANIIVDMATLTGAQAYATGLRHGGVLSNSRVFENMVVEAGRGVGDLAYPLLFCPELVGIATLMKSDIADMKNSASDRSNAPASGAGMFVHAHLVPEEKWIEDGEGWWAHIDMAYPVTVNSRGTGYGVGLLWNLAIRLDELFST